MRVFQHPEDGINHLTQPFQDKLYDILVIIFIEDKKKKRYIITYILYFKI